MDHIAIMKKSLNFIPLIIEGTKTIESRWYKNKVNPWNKININDNVYFKNSGELINIKAQVYKVIQYDHLNEVTVKNIINTYGQSIGLNTLDQQSLETLYNNYSMKNYCILIFLNEIKILDKPIKINKNGFGNMSAWISIEDIKSITCN